DLFEKLGENYFLLSRNRALLASLQEDLAWIDKNLSLVEKQEKLGFSPLIEVNRWRIERLEQLNRLRTTQGDIEQAEGSLKALTGLDKFSPEELKEPPRSDFSVDSLLQGAPELELIAEEKRGLSLDREILRNDWVPGFQLKTTLDTSPSNLGQEFALFAGLTFKPFHGGKEAAIEAIEARLKRNAFAEETKETTLRDFYRIKVLEVERGRETLQSLKEAQDLSQSNLNRLTMAYRKRYVDFLTLWEAHRKQFALRESYFGTLSELCQNQARLSYILSRKEGNPK
ncbi:MAG TPA: TolC family protein, partial [Chroococcales cyanobacterium]